MVFLAHNIGWYPKNVLAERTGVKNSPQSTLVMCVVRRLHQRRDLMGHLLCVLRMLVSLAVTTYSLAARS